MRLLTAILRNGTIPHALLFTGIEGVGKRTAAMTFAMACNCTAQNPIDPCGCCRSCRKIQSGSHPDIILVEPSGPLIRIAQIRALSHTIAMKPYEAQLRVVIISNAQAMNPEAGNALLKLLEEPPDQTILILTAAQTSDLLPTIVSRCQHIRFNPISRKEIAEMLVKKQGVDSDDAVIMATMANGSFSKALSMIKPANKVNWINRRNWLINTISQNFLDRSESLSLRPIGSSLAFAAKLSKNKEILFDSLEVIKSYLRDLVICKYCPEKIINKDLADNIQYTSQKIAAPSLLSKIEAVRRAQRDIEANTNLRLTLEAMIMRLAFGE